MPSIKVAQVVIAHRFSTIVHADNIHVIDQGQCVESGNYQQLMAQRGVFYHLARRQLVENNILNYFSVIIEYILLEDKFII